MRVLILSDWMSNTGGAESYTLSLRDALRKAGDNVQLLSCGPRSSAPEAGDLRAYGTDSLAAQTFLQIVNPFAVSRVRQATREFRPDVALVGQFAYHLSPAVIRAVSPVPAVVMVTDYKAICPLGTRLLKNGSICRDRAGAVCRTGKCVGALHWMRDQPRYSLIRSGLAGARRVLCASEWMAGELRQAGIDALTVPIAVASPRASFRRKPAGWPTFVYCGRLAREKGVALLIAAFSKLNLPNATLRIVGDGPLRSELERLAVMLGVSEQIFFRGWVEGDRLDHEISDAWAVVAPSLWAEPFGLAAVEAMVRGIPVIASDSGGFRDTIEPEVTGLLFPNGNVSALTSCMRSVALRRKFPDCRIHADVVKRMRMTYDLGAHASRIREVLAQAVACDRSNRDRNFIGGRSLHPAAE